MSEPRYIARVTEPLSWDIRGDGWQRVATDAATRFRFVITECTDPKDPGVSEWEIEQSGRGKTSLAYLPTLIEAVRECNLRVGRTSDV